MDQLLMLRGEDRHCPDCATTTIFLPVDADDGAGWVCTVCDVALAIDPFSVALHHAA
jgi:hypothetical protein